MITSHTDERPWDSLAYQQIASAMFANGRVVVRFENGDVVRLRPRDLVISGEAEPDWEDIRAEKYHVVAPSSAGEIEIPWDVIRLKTDPAFDAFWESIATEQVSAPTRRLVESAD